MPSLRTKRKSVAHWSEDTILPGESRDLALNMSASYSGQQVSIPLHVRRGLQEGPTVFVTAAVHGDEINGAGAIRELILDPQLRLIRGSLILVPVVNVLGFERHSRYLPDRRDLNRSFPGSAKGSLASRLARLILDEIIERSDFGIDLHTAAVRRTNFPNVRGDLENDTLRELAEVFGCEIILNEKGPTGCLRRAACDAGVPTFILEAGEVWKAETLVIEYALRGVRNVLTHLGMIDGTRCEPPFRTVIQDSVWVRSDTSGFLKFHVGPGDFVQPGAPLATTTSLLGKSGEVLTAPAGGVVLGITTLPVTSPGEPVVHIGLVPEGQAEVEQIVRSLPANSLHHRVRNDLSSGIMVVPAR